MHMIVYKQIRSCFKLFNTDLNPTRIGGEGRRDRGFQFKNSTFFLFTPIKSGSNDRVSWQGLKSYDYQFFHYKKLLHTINMQYILQGPAKSPCLMRISIHLFFKTFKIYLDNAIFGLPNSFISQPRILFTAIPNREVQGFTGKSL